jgi:hypothetical protein
MTERYPDQWWSNYPTSVGLEEWNWGNHTARGGSPRDERLAKEGCGMDWGESQLGRWQARS